MQTTTTKQLFDMDTVFEQIERTNMMVLSMIPDTRCREFATAVASASMDFGRAQVAASRDFAGAMKKVFFPAA